MSHKIVKLASLVFLAAMVGACATTVPVVAVSEEGIMRGSATASMEGGSFQLSDAKTKCSGTYDAFSASRTISMVVICDDRRKGIAVVTRDPGLMSGHGRVRLDDGMEADLLFGPAAAAF